MSDSEFTTFVFAVLLRGTQTVTPSRKNNEGYNDIFAVCRRNSEKYMFQSQLMLHHAQNSTEIVLRQI